MKTIQIIRTANKQTAEVKQKNFQTYYKNKNVNVVVSPAKDSVGGYWVEVTAK